jgi:ABC-type polysaccharide/polyol phosphate transport system ATPase subunit
MANDIVIELTGVTKQYKLVQTVSGIPRVKYALKNINLEIREGERWGIIGFNGSGKSTLLKTIAGIVKPTSGSGWRKGTLSHILEVGSNFIPELSGRENASIFFLTHGLKKDQVEMAVAKTIELADIGNYFDEAVKNYSSGMYLRVAFAASVQLSADVLLIDEVFSVGDASFREKIKHHLFETFTRKRTLMLVSHNPEEIVEMCTHGLWLEKGEIKMIGTAKEVEAAYYHQLAKEYSETNYLNPVNVLGSQKQSIEFEPAENDYILINSFQIAAPPGYVNIAYETGICFRIDIIKKVNGVTLHPQITIFDYLMKPIVILIPGAHSKSEKVIIEQKEFVGKIHFEAMLNPRLLSFGTFYAELRFGKDISANQIFNEEIIRLPVKIPFEVMQGKVHDYIGGTDVVFIKPECEWSIKAEQ